MPCPGFGSFIQACRPGGTRTRVRVGPAMNRAEADALKAQVKAKAGIDGIRWVTKCVESADKGGVWVDFK